MPKWTINSVLESKLSSAFSTYISMLSWIILSTIKERARSNQMVATEGSLRQETDLLRVNWKSEGQRKYIYAYRNDRVHFPPHVDIMQKHIPPAKVQEMNALLGRLSKKEGIPVNSEEWSLVQQRQHFDRRCNSSGLKVLTCQEPRPHLNQVC